LVPAKTGESEKIRTSRGRREGAERIPHPPVGTNAVSGNLVDM
jgi:hypothetical protein